MCVCIGGSAVVWRATQELAERIGLKIADFDRFLDVLNAECYVLKAGPKLYKARPWCLDILADPWAVLALTELHVGMCMCQRIATAGHDVQGLGISLPALSSRRTAQQGVVYPHGVDCRL
jgi:hypothetical protein